MKIGGLVGEEVEEKLKSWKFGKRVWNRLKKGRVRE